MRAYPCMCVHSCTHARVFHQAMCEPTVNHAQMHVYNAQIYIPSRRTRGLLKRMSEGPNTPDGRGGAPAMLSRPLGTRRVALLQGIQALRGILVQGSDDQALLEAKLAAQKEKKEGATDEVTPTLCAYICTPTHMHARILAHCLLSHTFIHSKYLPCHMH